MTRHSRAAHLPLVPAVAFVLVWSSGYISGPAAVQAAAPFTVLAWRFVLAAVLAVGISLALRRPTRMDRATLGRVAAVGLVMNAVQFGLMYVAFDLGLGATLASLFHALSPVLTALLAAAILGERVSGLQVGGFVVGVVGVLLVLGGDLGRAGGPAAVLIGCLSMLTLSLGTLGQRWIGAQPDLLWSAAVQFAVSAPPLLLLGWATEGAWPVTDARQALVAVLFLAIVNSIVGLVLLSLLVLRGGSGAAASLFFLSPPVTAVLAWVVLDETLSALQLVGLLVAVVGVGAATRTRTTVVPPPG
ncbi:peptide ABC transporter ATP-binding protein [Nocardioides flavus (ex Wang et al. 2016)]|uniref:Peptide ABC transporter ATP-binding protein n=1 Tax=Nocardioides flavus (ex Wang et al. 2016) TaxID=2058780 RepID=A0ABQ3HIM7_9ACTN|nr:DMT family transporter [Nocardioides flavus (ex Wang et al. 2016)]GHE17517.1 peptide ABC transporter ATP-binding protein [Nocardioides flavus (ex Wang et al. 2016)]